MAQINDVVLVHGGFVDGAGWRGVYDILEKDSFNVSVVQNPTISLTGDVAATKMVIHSRPNPVILVGHSYGGVVITEAGTDPNHRLCPGRGRVGQHADRQSAARRAGAADFAAPGRLSVP